MIYYNKHQTYLPPLIICLLLIAQANYLSGHRSRHTDIESSDDKKTNSDSFGTKTKGKHWTEKWETNHYKNGEKKKFGDKRALLQKIRYDGGKKKK